MKKVLVLSASARKNGNSDLLCNEFMKGAIEAGHEVEKIYVAYQNIKPCVGCGYCFESNKCSQKDDMNDIIEKMVDADVLVFATPIYFYSMNAQMKTLIDRTTPRYRDMKNKECYYILTAADTDPNNFHRTMEAFRGFSEDCLDGAIEKGILYGTGVWHAGEVKDTKHMQDAYNMGKHV